MKVNHRRKQHSKKCKSKISAKGFLCPKIDSIIEKQNNFVVNYRDSFYLPRMSFQGLMRFTYTLFNKREKSIAMIDFWNTLGNRKAIISAEDTQKYNILYDLVINFKILYLYGKSYSSPLKKNA